MFKWPAETAAALLGGWDIKLNLAGLVASAKPVRSDINAAVFQGLVWPGRNVWVWWRARVDAHAPRARFWFQVGYGSRSRTAPTFDREIVAATLPDGDVRVIEAPDDTDKRILHGQGIALRTCEVDFSTGKVTWFIPPAFEPTTYVPRDGTQTGGLWGYMEAVGQDVAAHDVDYWRAQLYPMGAYGGKFMHDGDVVNLVTEADVPLAVAGAYFHEHAKDKGWINYTVPSAPWRDRPAFRLVEADDQHNEILDTVAQCCEEFPDDEGFAMLLLAGAEFWLKAQPGIPKGTTHHYGLVGRRDPGRNLKTFIWLHRVLDKLGETYLRDLIAARVLQRWEATKAAAEWNVRDHGHILSFYGGDRVNPSEVGIHFAGLSMFSTYLDRAGVHDPEVDWLKDYFAELLFNWFRDDWTAAPGKLAVPWTVDGQTLQPTTLTSPASSSHFAWFGATRYKPKTEAEAEKLARILRLDTPIRFKGGNF